MESSSIISQASRRVVFLLAHQDQVQSLWAHSMILRLMFSREDLA